MNGSGSIAEHRDSVEKLTRVIQGFMADLHNSEKQIGSWIRFANKRPEGAALLVLAEDVDMVVTCVKLTSALKYLEFSESVVQCAEQGNVQAGNPDAN